MFLKIRLVHITFCCFYFFYLFSCTTQKSIRLYPDKDSKKLEAATLQISGPRLTTGSFPVSIENKTEDTVNRITWTLNSYSGNVWIASIDGGSTKTFIGNKKSPANNRYSILPGKHKIGIAFDGIIFGDKTIIQTYRTPGFQSAGGISKPFNIFQHFRKPIEFNVEIKPGQTYVLTFLVGINDYFFSLESDDCFVTSNKDLLEISGDNELIKKFRSSTTSNADTLLRNSNVFIKAIENGDIQRVRELLDKGEDVNAKISYELTPLIAAARAGQTEIVNLLISKGAGVNAKTFSGFTPLMAAVSSEHFDTAKLLISRLARVNSKTNIGWTALMFAANDGNIELVKLLLKRGAEVNVKNFNRSTALSLAKRKCLTEIVQVLKEAGAT